jgi:ABC-type oligopeptide transport system ATPase subunit
LTSFSMPNPKNPNNGQLLVLNSATVVRSTGEVIFQNLTWSVREEETWAVVGTIGSGKTSLAETILGRFLVQTGTIAWPFIERLRAKGRSINWPSDVFRYVSFKEQSYLFSYGRHYYQQRFNFIEPQDDHREAGNSRSTTVVSYQAFEWTNPPGSHRPSALVRSGMADSR